MLIPINLNHLFVFEFSHGMQSRPDEPCLGVREMTKDGTYAGTYKWTSYKDTYKRFMSIGSGLCKLGLQPVMNGCIIFCSIEKLYSFHH